MPVPPLDEKGNLPPGVHLVTLTEVEKVFGHGSPRRDWLWKKLVEIVEIVRTSGKVKRLIIWGSFVTWKEIPGDLDLLLITDANPIRDNTSDAFLDLLDHERARRRFHADVFWMKESIGAAIIQEVLDVYQLDRTRRVRGIIEVAL